MKGRRLAILIGINKYSCLPQGDLSCAVQDASDLALTLSSPSIGSFDECITLYDENASLQKCEDELHKLLCAYSTPDDLVLLYYAGHSILDSASHLCLCTADYDPRSPVKTSLHASRLRVLYDNSASRRIVTILDTCYSASASQHLGYRRSISDELRAMNELSGEGQIVLASSSANQTSRESPELGHGIFTHYLLKGLRGAAISDENGLIGTASLFNYVSKQFKKEDLQTPRFYGRDLTGDIFLARNIEARREPESPSLIPEDTIPSYFEITFLRSIEHASPKNVYSCEVAVDLKVDTKTERAVFRGKDILHVAHVAIQGHLHRYFPTLRLLEMKRAEISTVNDKASSERLYKVYAEWNDGVRTWATIGLSQELLKAVGDAIKNGINWKLKLESNMP